MAYEPIRLSAFGRPVHPGDFYDYFNDSILTGFVEVPKECVESVITTSPEMERFFCFDQREKFKDIMLGIHSHLYESIKEKVIDVNRLWFASYPTSVSPKIITAEVHVFFRVVRKTEKLGQHFIDSQMYNFRKTSRGRATHVVQEVNYGVELFCSITKYIINPAPEEKKEDVEERMYSAAKLYFDQQTNEQEWTPPPTELTGVVCTIMSSLNPGEVKLGSFQESCVLIREAIFQPNEWRPVDILLCYIPAQLEVQLLLAKVEDKKLEIENSWKLIMKESHRLNHLNIDRVPPLKNFLCKFQDSLGLLWNPIENLYAIAILESQNQEKMLKQLEFITEFQTLVIDWLKQRRKDIEAIHSLLHGIELEMVNLEDIEAWACSSGEIHFEVFILKIDYILDPLMERIYQTIGLEIPNVKLPVFPIISTSNDRLKICSKLKLFSLKGRLRSNSNKIYKIGLVPISSSYEDGTVKTISPICLKHDQATKLNKAEQPSKTRLYDHLFPPTKPQSLPVMSSLLTNQSGWDTYIQLSTAESSPNNPKLKQEEGNNSCIIDKGITGKVGNIENQQSKVETKADSVSANDVLGDSSKKQIQPTKQINDQSFLSVGARIEKYNSEKKLKDDSSDGNSNYEKQSPKMTSIDQKEDNQLIVMEQSNNVVESATIFPLSNNRRAAELFADETCHYSVKVKQGQPSVYLLNATEKPSLGVDLRWFVVGKSTAVPPPIDRKNHKVIILMGATGCGKRTLINGMFNYILGVQWNDPFRFKVVREDASAAGRNQAESQTSSVTAYTLHHHSGMAVPYSITIIDTPGYGDTRGVERDKEITRTIHRFLTQPEIRIDQIHAACFVAASGDSRLTATQRYILDSILSIFGKDVKENIRLLVTFADNADPPVVEACLAAHFPVTSQSAGITYSKFNSSVLYASNHQLSGEDDFSFDELFWDMGQENFHKFFSMLEGMNGRDLTSTREVIQRRQQVEQSLKNIELKLEVCLVNIENKEIFLRKLKECGHQIEANKNYSIETTEIRFIKNDCKKGFMSYNCCHCNKTCEAPAKVSNLKTRLCKNRSCKCRTSDHQFQPFEWHPTSVKTKMTMKEVKAEYESNLNRKMSTEQLLDNCVEESDMAKASVLSLLEQLGFDARILDSTALRSNALSPADYLSLMRSKVLEDQAPGYLTRLETLSELQNRLAADASIQGRLVKPNCTTFDDTKKAAEQSCGRSRDNLLLTSDVNLEGGDCSGPTSPAIKSSLSNPSIPSSESIEKSEQINFAQQITNPACDKIGKLKDQVVGKKQLYRNDFEECQPTSSSTSANYSHDQHTRRRHPEGEPEDYYSAATSKGNTSSNQSPYVKERAALINSQSRNKNETDKTEYSSDEETSQRGDSKVNVVSTFIRGVSKRASSFSHF